MAHPKTLKLWNEDGEHVVLNVPVPPRRNATEESADFIAYQEANQAIEEWKERGYTLDKNPDASAEDAEEEAPEGEAEAKPKKAPKAPKKGK